MSLPSYDPNELAHRHLDRGDPTGWFEPLYAHAGPNGEGVPWVRLSPHPDLASWLDSEPLEPDGRRALVVGCGLGDDAEELARRGYDVTAFDISPSAIARCRERFPDSPVDYTVADLFDPPGAWHRAFDLVAEIITVQALPPALQVDAIHRIATFVAPRGRAFVVSRVRDAATEPIGPPWPVVDTTFDAFEMAGLVPLTVDQEPIGSWTRTWHMRAVYVRPD